MKKLFFFSLLLMVGVLWSNGQTQRMVMYEGFSNASCSPCAAANPAVNALLFANPTKVVAIKYQVNWPGSDPMNAQTQTWVGPRVSYYTISAVPATKVDGATASMNQTTVNNRYAVPSPFFMEVNHTFNAAEDSAFVEVYVKAAQAYSGTNLVLHMAMVEKHIHFASSAGSNGETDFYNVMRKMYPSSTGTTLPGTWTLDQDTTFYFAIPIPAYIYDFDQIAFVAFIQSNTDKSVLQACKTTLNQYISIMSHNIPQDPVCLTEFAIEVKVVNQGKTVIDSFDIEYGIVGGTPDIYKWTGSLDYGDEAIVLLPAITLPAGEVDIYAEVQNPNGGVNESDMGTYVEGTIIPVNGYTAVPATQDFTAVTFPPTDWALVSDDALKWVRANVGGFAQSPLGAAKIEFYNSPGGAIDIMYMNGLDFSSMASAQLTFSLSHARYSSSYSDNLRVDVSSNCGQTWTTVYNKSGALLATVATYVTSAFTPTTAAQWRTETIDLNGFAGQSEVLIRFKAVSGFGNNLYIDDINIGLNTAEVSSFDVDNSMVVYPNPATEQVHVGFVMMNTGDVQIRIYDISGKIVWSSNETLPVGEHTVSVGTTQWPAGIYNVVITTADGVSSEKIIRQ